MNNAARLHGVSVEWIRARIHDGTLPAYRLHSRAFYVFYADLRGLLRSLPTVQSDTEVTAARHVIRRHEERKRARINGRKK